VVRVLLPAAAFAATALTATAFAAEDLSFTGPNDAAKGKKATVVQAGESIYGDALFDGKGFVVYLFTKDRRSGLPSAGTARSRSPTTASRSTTTSTTTSLGRSSATT
jgi:hypothetical protein